DHLDASTHGQHTASHGDVMLSAARVLPGQYRNREYRQEVRVPRQHPEAAGRILGPDVSDVFGPHEGGKWRRNREFHVRSTLRVRGGPGLALRLTLARFSDVAHHIERSLGPGIRLSIEDRRTARERCIELDRSSGDPGERLRDHEWLGQKAHEEPRPLD